MYNFDSYNVLLAIATNIPVLLMNAFVLQAHIYVLIYKFNIMQPMISVSQNSSIHSKWTKIKSHLYYGL